MTDATSEPSDSLIIDKPAEAALDFSQGKPEGFPDDFWDAEKKTPAIDKLFKEFNTQKARADGLRVKLSKGEFDGKAPEDIKEYTLELDEKLKPLVPDDDPLIGAAREAAKANGMPKEMFNKFLTPIIAKLAEIKGEADAQMTPEAVEAERIAKVEQLGPSGGRIVEALGQFINKLHAGGTFSEAEAKAAKAMVFDADTARVMNKLRMMAGDSDQVPVDVPVGDQSSRSEIQQKMAAAMLSGNELEYTKYSNMLARAN